MELEDLKLISKLIHKYGIGKMQDIVEANYAFLEYMKKDKEDKKYRRFCENENSKIFTNLKSSIFILNNNIIDFDLLKTNTQNPIALNTDINEMQKYLDNAKQLMGYNPSNVGKLYTTSKSGILIGFDRSVYGTSEISLEDYKMIDLLLKNYKIYVSQKEPIVHVEAENGYAYVLGNYRRFKTIF